MGSLFSTPTPPSPTHQLPVPFNALFARLYSAKSTKELWRPSEPGPGEKYDLCEHGGGFYYELVHIPSYIEIAFASYDAYSEGFDGYDCLTRIGRTYVLFFERSDQVDTWTVPWEAEEFEKCWKEEFEKCYHHFYVLGRVGEEEEVIDRILRVRSVGTSGDWDLRVFLDTNEEELKTWEKEGRKVELKDLHKLEVEDGIDESWVLS
ncbi:hypothetical protein BJ508DRAFT_304669 [Ascobolus immersus RN42]|uniref:Uncharacterized protein n=1 Tax=Ascobolus immersus RN42 TaxID=1160509 RepID=A0A3N4IH14_ASCIM|nr:hypothetical protein BJ508DRAFT_304669 [Ascobolus immersus RN42]